MCVVESTYQSNNSFPERLTTPGRGFGGLKVMQGSSTKSESNYFVDDNKTYCVAFRSRDAEAKVDTVTAKAYCKLKVNYLYYFSAEFLNFQLDLQCTQHQLQHHFLLFLSNSICPLIFNEF